MQNQPNWSYPAPHGKRLTAFLIDAIICQLVVSVMVNVLGLEALSKSKIEFGITVLYFTLLQWKFGATLGKKMMNLELVTQGSENSPDFMRTLGRETIGRILSVISLFGYFMIFRGQHREALHDRIFKTYVVSQIAPEEGSSILKWALGTIGALASLGAVGFYVLFFTSLPIVEYAKKLEAEGLRMDGIKGSLARGFSVAKLSYTADGNSLEADHVVFAYDNIFRSINSDEFHIREMSVSKMVMHTKNNTTANTLIDESRKKMTPLEKNQTKAPKKNINLKIDRIDINNLQIVYKDNESISAKRFFISGIEIKNKSFKIERLWLESKLAILDGQKMSYADNLVKIENGSLILKKEIKEDTLAADLDIHFKISADLQNKLFEGKIEGFRKSVMLSFNGKSIDFKTTNFQPHWFFKETPPLYSLNLSATGTLPEILGPALKGTYKIRHHTFKIIEGKSSGLLAAETDFGGSKVTSKLELVGKRNFVPIFNLSISRDGSEDLPSLLSHLYFSKEVASLTEVEKSTLSLAQKHFKMATPDYQQIWNYRMPASSLPPPDFVRPQSVISK